MAILGDKNSTQAIRSVGLADWLEAHGIEGWLEIATDDLEAAAKKRITEEIEAHYSEAVSAHLTAGLTEGSAQTSALAQLGDPTVAARNFRKRHLTEAQVKAMQRMERTASKPLFSLWMLPFDVLIPLVSIFLICQHRFWLVGVYALMAFVGFRLIPRSLCQSNLSHTHFIKELAFCSFLTQVALMVPYGLFLWSIDHRIFWPSAFCLEILFISNIKSNSPLRIWNKLRKAE
jgi:uncharacterized membrane protein